MGRNNEFNHLLAILTCQFFSCQNRDRQDGACDKQNGACYKENGGFVRCYRTKR